jgi:glycosyltransferase involved in cell wall biosynthesis
LRRANRNPFKDVFSILELIKIYRAERPDLVHHVALKAALYGTLAARFAQIPAVVNAFAGMGYAFSSSQTRARLFKPLIQAGFRMILKLRNGRVIVQNPDDLELLMKANILQRENARLIKGSGVEPEHFVFKPELPGDPIIILASRMLWDKGIGEFVGAARKLMAGGTRARFVLVGKIDPDNPASVPIRTLREWQEEGTVEWWGYQEDMPKIFSKAHIVCLPSFYGEGVPKVLIEAASCGRPIVTTDTPGCREIVREGENGFLIPPRDTPALAKAIQRLIDVPSLRESMGERGREIAIRDFSLKRVVSETMEVYRELLLNKSSR